MSEFLETTVDKFIFRVATDRFYNATGVWALAEGNVVRVGLSDFLQQRSGDVAFAEVKPEGTVLAVEMRSPPSKPSRSISSCPARSAEGSFEVNPAMETAPEADQPGPVWRGLAVRDRAVRLGSRPRWPCWMRPPISRR